MGLLVSLFENRSQSPADDGPQWSDYQGGGKSNSGVNVSTQTALTYSAFWKGVNLISRDVGKLSLYIDKRKTPKGWENAPEHPGYTLLRHKPNEYTTSIVFRQVLQGHALTEGNGFAYIHRNGAGEPIELIILDPRRVEAYRSNGTVWYIYTFETSEQRKIIYTDMIHIKGFGYDGLVGYSVIQKARENLGLALARETYAAVFFKNNARPNMVLEHPGKLQPKAAENLRASFERIHSGLENAHRTAVLEEGMKAHELSINASDSQLIEQEKFGLIHVANWLGLPPHKVGGEGRTAYASLEMENQAYLDEGLDPWLVTHEEEYRDKLLTEEEKRADSHRVRFDRNQLLRANQSARGSFYVQMMQWGVFSPDEVRTQEGENPQANDVGDVYYRPLNMGIVGKDGEVKAIAPAAPDGGGFPPKPPAAPKAEPIADDGRAKQAAIFKAMEPVLADAVRRMVRRISVQAERAASDGKRYAAWLDTMDADNSQTINDNIAPGAMGRHREIADWLAKELHTRFLDVSGECTAKELPGKVAALGVSLGEELPKLARRKFLRCGGVGSGVPGPCPEGGEGDSGGKDDKESDDAQSPEDKEREEIDSSREEEDQGISDQRDEEDSNTSDERDAEDEKISEARDAEDETENDARESEDAGRESAREEEDKTTEEKREEEDQADTEASDAELQRDSDRSDEDDATTESRDKEDEITNDAREKEDEATQEARDKEDEDIGNARSKEDSEQTKRQMKEDEDYKAARDELRDKLDQNDEDALDKHDEETDAGIDALSDKHEKEDAAMESQREKADAALDKDREKEDKSRQSARDKQDKDTAAERKAEDKETKADRDKEDKESPKSMTVEQYQKVLKQREKDDAATAKNREKEDGKIESERESKDAAKEKARTKEDDALESKRDKENKERDTQRAKEDSDLKKERDQEDKEFQKKYASKAA